MYTVKRGKQTGTSSFNKSNLAIQILACERNIQLASVRLIVGVPTDLRLIDKKLYITFRKNHTCIYHGGCWGTGSNALLIVDVGCLQQPKIIGIVETAGNPIGMTYEKTNTRPYFLNIINKASLKGEIECLQIFSIMKPDNPVLKKQIELEL